MQENKNINDKILKKINDFVKKLSFNIKADTEEIKDFEDEMTSNLISSFNDLANEGYTNEEALKLTFSKFGDTDYLRNELNELYNTKKVYAKIILKATIITVFVGMLLFFSSIIYNAKIMPLIVENSFKTISEHIRQEEDIQSNEIKNRVKQIVKSNYAITAVVIDYTDEYAYHNNIDNRNIYNYPENLNLSDKDGFYWGLGYGENNLLIFTNTFYSNRSNYSLSDLNYNVSLQIKMVDTKFLLLIVIIIYWIMFFVWSSLTIHFNKENKLWIVLVAFTNIIGYALYYFYKNQSKYNI